MKTDDLVTLLATSTAPVDRNLATHRYAIALVCGVLVSVVLMTTLLGVRHDLNGAARLPMFWAKIVFVAVLASTSAVVALRLSRPGTKLPWAPGALIAPVVAMWMLAAYALVNADPAQRHSLIYGSTSAYCPLLIAILAVPVFVAVTWAMRGLAPTRLRLAGAAAGLVSGTLGAVVYSLHCPEMAAPFVGLWYLLGILIPTGIGALLGPRLLAW